MEDSIYQVKQGDNLTKIANQYKTTVADLAKYNSIKNPNLIFAGSTLKIPGTTSTQAVNPSVSPQTRSKYINPETGKYFTPEEYGNYVATKIPASKPAADVPRYAGDAMTNPNRSATDLEGIARNLNNARNDIAVGQTDPYKVGNQSGIAYSPAELNAIEKAYAGIYDPALNDVFARLKEKQASDKQAADDKQYMERQILQTNENIRQWKATTGSKDGGRTGVDSFTRTQLNNAARNSGLSYEVFSQLDDYDLINFFVQPPMDLDETTGKQYQMNKTFDNLIRQVKAGTMKSQEAADEINSSNLPSSVKHYYLDQLPATDVEKQGWFSRVWNAIIGK